jgi:hypothetical protein
VKHRTLSLLAAALALAACKPDKPQAPAGVISRDKFVAANVAVRLVSDTAPQALRDSALKKAGVTDRQLRAWVTAHSRDPEFLAKTWEQIAFKVDSMGGAQPVPPGAVPMPPMAAGGRPAPIELPDSLVLRRDDSLRFRRPPGRRDPPRLPRRRDDEGVNQAPIRVQ